MCSAMLEPSWYRSLTSFKENRNLICSIFVLEHDAYLLLEFMGLTLFIEVVVQAHVDETTNVCSCFHVHYLPCRGIDLVRSLVPQTEPAAKDL